MSDFHVPITVARRSKWEAYRAGAGMAADAPFVGDPLVECYDEFLDALNYLDAAGNDPDLFYLRRDTRKLAVALQTYLLRRERGQANGSTDGAAVGGAAEPQGLGG